MNRLHQYVARLLHLPSDASRSFGKLRLEESIDRMDSSIETAPKAEWIHDGMTDSEIVKAVYYGTFPLHILSLDIDRNMELTFHNEKLWIISCRYQGDRKSTRLNSSHVKRTSMTYYA